MTCYGWGGVSKEWETNDPENDIRKSRSRMARLKVLSISYKSLGVEG